MADRTHTILLWRSVGPYHLARARAAAKRLRGRGGAVTLVELCDAEQTRDWVVDRSREPMRIVTLKPGLKLDARTPPLTKELIALLEGLRPSHIVVAGYDRPEMREAMHWGRRNGAGVILMSETKWDDRSRRPWWRRAIVSRWIKAAEAALVSGGPAGEYLVAHGISRERIFRQYGAVDNPFFMERAEASRAAGRRPAGLPERYFIACARFIDQRKNFSRLLRAYAAYGRMAGDDAAGLVICGDGDDRPIYERMIRDLRLTNVHLPGFKQADELVDYYAHALAFIHPAVNEAWGLVVNEAMACGLPVLVSRRCGCAWDLVKEGVNGFTFDPHQVDEMSRCMREVVELTPDQRRRMGDASRDIIAHFGPEAFAEGLVAAMDACSVRAEHATGAEPSRKSSPSCVSEAVTS